MKLLLKRTVKADRYTIGKLYIDGVYFCDTLEDTDRGLFQYTPLKEIVQIKQKDITAIPAGTYKITLDVVSPKYSQEKYKKQYEFCGGRVPRLLNVPGYDGILIHIGNKHKDTDGCLLVGKHNGFDQIVNSTDAFNELYEKLLSGWNLTKDIQITIE
jgi:hypothetical protein